MKKKIFSFIILASCLFFFSLNCSSLEDLSTLSTLLYIDTSLSSIGGRVTVRENSSTGNYIATASVKVNGVDFPYVSTDNYYYNYGNGLVVDPGDTVEVVVSWNGIVVTGSGVIPYSPTIIIPTEGSSYSVSAPLEVQWSFGLASHNPDFIMVEGQNPSYLSDILAGTTVEYTIPANTFDTSLTPAGTIAVLAINENTTLSQYAAPSSNISTTTMGILGVIFTNP